MDLLVAWVALPLVLAALCLGCGLLVERLAGIAVPGVALVPLGLCAIVVAGSFTTATDGTAELTTPLVVVLAVAGLLLRGRGLGDLLVDRWAAVAAVAVFAVFAAPIVISGSATFAGYIRLDDTATWLAFTDRIMEHGRDLSGLPPSTYEATLSFNLAHGYPIGVFIPLGVGHELVGLDPAWTFQPYLGFLGATLALGLAGLARAVVTSARGAAIVAFVAAQPALLYGYYLWGGIKEMATAAVLAVIALLVPTALAPAAGPRALLAVAVAVAALLAMLSLGGAVWLVPIGIAGIVLAWRAVGGGETGRRVVLILVEVAVLSIPVLTVGKVLPPTSSPLTSAEALGNLFHPLNGFQVAGIWPVGDFRVSPSGAAAVVAGVLIAIVIATAAIGAWRAWRVAAVPLLLFGLGVLASGLAVAAIGSPWVGAKSLAVASACLLALAATAAVALYASGARVVGATLLAAIAAGVLWSNALAYRDVNLAPRAQLAELETIGKRIAGKGPTLMTEYQPYGVRHFLRDAAPEGASELRRRLDPLLSGRGLSKGGYADTDRFELSTIMRYRTLVLRRSPSQSRPPAPYRLTWRGHYYEVWQRPPGTRDAVIAHLGLGRGVQPGAVPPCGAVRRLAARAGATGALAAVPREPVEGIPLSSLARPSGWSAGLHGTFIPDGPGTIRASVPLTRAGDYGIWLRGGVRPQVDLEVDGRPVNSVRGELQNLGQYVELGTAHLRAGVNRIAVRFGGADLIPGSNGNAGPIGPLVLSRQDTGDTRVRRYPVSQARRLCGRRWDWIEALPGPV